MSREQTSECGLRRGSRLHSKLAGTWLHVRVLINQKIFIAHVCKATQGVRILASDCTGELFLFRMPLDGGDYRDILCLIEQERIGSSLVVCGFMNLSV